ncbi:Disease resistance protein RPM1 [Spatholobus suberectus]|nr:Disease resistance protein RPM1 [Spatholobus suberectus]
MAEIAVSFALDKLLPLIIDEANLLRGIPGEFEDIQKELEYIQGSLESADRRAAEEGDNTNKGIKTWVKDLREASFRIEDVIDEYMIYVEQQPQDRGCATSLRKVIHFIKTLMHRHRLASEIQQINSFVRGIKQRGMDYHFLIHPSPEQGPSSYRGSQSVQWHDPRLRSRYLEEAQVVGIEGPRDELIGWLVQGPAERNVISVVGMGGLGKTTLVSSVFNNQKVIAHFDYHAWITVSQSYIVERLLRDLLKKLCKEKRVDPPQGISEMDRDSLIDEVRNYLQQKRYVVIFDDVWSVELWGQIENAMLDNKIGSRILITTRMDGVVDSCKNSPSDKVHVLKPLTQEESMELFCKKAFQCHNNGRCPDDLKKISTDFVEKCNGLPLAIVAIAGLLSGKEKTLFEWEKIRRSLSSEMGKNPHLIGITKILGFSYDDLPYYLKSCLLYFGIYPEDYEVNSKRLIWQWIAEGFVKDEEGKTLEDIAQQYLTELIGRSLVQVSSFSIDGKAKSCRVHDLLHDMILRKFKDLSFCQHISKEDESMSSGMIRRLSISIYSNDLIRSTKSSHTRSLLVFADEEDALTNNFVQRIPTKYRLLKVLDFQDGPLSFVPKNWGNLAHLKYLNLRNSAMPTQFPKFIGKLQNLETLEIRNANVCWAMPKEICKLRKLRHLLGGWFMTLFQLKNGLRGMTSLQTLRHVYLTMDDDDDGVELIRNLGKLKQLRNLSLTGVKEEQGSALCSSINEMTNLEKLRIYSNGDEVIDLAVISSLPMLRKLWLEGKLKKFPEWVPQLRSLVQLSLIDSKLADDPLKSLQNMPHLLFLEMRNSYEGESLYFQDGWFQQLRELSLHYLLNLKSIVIDKGALHSLEKLLFYRIPELKTVPAGIQHLEKLEVLHICIMSTEFKECIAPDGGPEHPIIQHVPLVKIDGRTVRHSRH